MASSNQSSQYPSPSRSADHLPEYQLTDNHNSSMAPYGSAYPPVYHPPNHQFGHFGASNGTGPTMRASPLGQPPVQPNGSEASPFSFPVPMCAPLSGPLPNTHQPPAGPHQQPVGLYNAHSPVQQYQQKQQFCRSQQQPLYLGAPIPTGTLSQGLVGFEPMQTVERIKKAVKGFGTDEPALISALVPLTSLQVDAVAKAYKSNTGKSLPDVLEKETGSWFRMGLLAIAEGPVDFDVKLVRRAISGVGTNEDLLNELLLGRTNEEINLLKKGYESRYNRSLETDVADDLSGFTQQLFTMALDAQRTPDHVTVNQEQVMADAHELHRAGVGKIGVDEFTFCRILVSRSQPHLAALAQVYKTKYNISLTCAIEREISGHLKDALLYIARGAKYDGWGIRRDAKLLEKTMKGRGTKDEQLVWRIMRLHWNTYRFNEVKAAYQRKYKKPLVARVKDETSGDYRRLMAAVIE